MAQLKNEELLIKVGNVLKELRKKKGILQADMLNDTGIHIARAEGAQSNLSLSTLAALAEYLDIRLSDFFKMVEKQK